MALKNSNNGFLTISLIECGNIYPVVKENAERHFNCAEILAMGKEYSNAIAHLILGTEELLKAFALFLESKQFELRKIEGYKHLFFNHKARHSILKDFYSAIILIKKIIDLVENTKKQHWIMQAIDVLHRSLVGIIDANNNHDWWEKAESLKQSCFYVDYKSGVINPSNIDQNEYLKANKFVKLFREDIRFIIAGFSRASQSEIEEFKGLFRDTNLKQLLGGTIKKSLNK